MIVWVSTGSYTDQYPVSFGGIQTGEFSVLEEFARQRLIKPLHLVVIGQSGQKKEEKLFRGNLQVHRILKPYPFGSSTDTEFRTAFAIEAKKIVHKLLVENKIKVIQLCSTVPARCFMEWDIHDSFSGRKKPKFVYSVHNALTLAGKPAGSFVSKADEWHIQKKAELEVIKRADKVICTSKSFKDFISKKYSFKNNLFFIPNTVGPSSFFEKINRLENPQWSKTILCLGRLSKEKRVDRVIEAFKILIQKGLNYSLVIAGDGEQKEEIRKLISINHLNFSNSLNLLPKTVHMIGMITGIAKWRILRSSRVIACLSDYEVSPLVGYESLALGVPIVASDLDQWKELVDHGRNGFIVDRFKCQEIANCLAKILESDEIYSKMSFYSRREYKEKYDSRIITQKRYKLIYKSLLEN